MRRIAALYKQGYNAEEIAADKNHLNIAQVYAAITYYHANREEIDTDLAEEQAEYERLAALHKAAT
ncbi:asl2786 [Nostoc sp. PCC 7120 = FACHB-418]|nr:asl2786 [Nostoc sp. PCC 7120 = FACHB-418]